MLRLYNLLQIEILVSFPISMTTDLTLISQTVSSLRQGLGIISAFACSKLTVETLEQGLKYVQSDVFMVNFEHISHLVLVFLLLTLNM